MFGLFFASIAQADRLILDFKDGLSIAEVSKIAGADLEWVHPNSEDESLSFLETDQADALINKLKDHPEIEAIERSIVYEALEAPNDPLYSQQWNMQLIGAEEGWEKGGGQGVLVAVIDTGVAPVEDLSTSQLREGVSFVVGEPSWHDINGHGTHVAGTIAQATNNAFGAAGLAPNVDILPLKALSQYGSGQSEWIASAIDEAVDQGAQVINMSLGGSRSTVIEVATKKAIKAGVLVVAAAGNNGREGVSSPASIDGVVAVSATGPKDGLAPYSSWGKEVSISAPGGDKNQKGGGILQQTVKGGKAEFLELQGTSMATPHVAGAAAVLIGAGAGTPTNVKELLYSSAHDLGAEGWDKKFGHGRLNLSSALEQLTIWEHGIRGSFAFVIALFVGGLARQGFGRMALLTTTSLAAAGGLYWLPFIGSLFHPILNYFPNALWQSALPWAVLALALLPLKRLRWIGAACCIAAIVHFGGGLLDQQLASPIKPILWFPINAILLCIPITLAVLAGRFMEDSTK